MNERSRDQKVVHDLLIVLDHMKILVDGTVSYTSYADRMRIYMAIERIKPDES